MQKPCAEKNEQEGEKNLSLQNPTGYYWWSLKTLYYLTCITLYEPENALLLQREYMLSNAVIHILSLLTLSEILWLIMSFQWLNWLYVAVSITGTLLPWLVVNITLTPSQCTENSIRNVITLTTNQCFWQPNTLPNIQKVFLSNFFKILLTVNQCHIFFQYLCVGVYYLRQKSSPIVYKYVQIAWAHIGHDKWM